jgi:hypothetical protein
MTNKPDLHLIIDDLLNIAYEESMKSNGVNVDVLLGALVLLREQENNSNE